MSDTTILGSMAFDEIETPFGKSGKIIGGSATYIAYAVSKFLPVNVVSIIGKDFPKTEIEKLISKKVNLDGVIKDEKRKTFFWKGKYHLDMNTRDTLKTELNVLEDFKPIVPKSYQKSDFLLLGNLHPAVQMSVLKQMTQKPKLVVLDTMNLWIDIALDDLIKIIKCSDVVMINDSEARQISREYSLIKAARFILDMGVKFVVIKKGEHGALLFHKKYVFAVPAMPLEEVFDPTGAGDTFAGGFLGYLAKSRDISFENMKSALIVGSALASICVEKFGIERIKEISTKEMDKRINEFVKLISFDIEIGD